MKNEKKRTLVVGLGVFGSVVAQTLGKAGHEVVAVDIDMERVDAVKQFVAWAMQLDATDARALESAEVSTCSTAIIAVGDFEAALLCAVALKEAGITNLVARARSAAQAKIFAAVGASRVVEVEAEMARALAESLT